MLEHFVLFNKVCPQEKLLPELHQPTGDLSEPNLIGAREIPNSSPCSHPVPSERGENWKSTGEGHTQCRHSGSPKDWDLILGLQSTSLPPTTCLWITKDLFTAVTCTQYIRSSMEQKTTRHAKRQQSLTRESKRTNQRQIWQACCNHQIRNFKILWLVCLGI